MNTQFSCLIACYHKDSPEFLRQALQSLLDQSVIPSEVVFVEDGELTEKLYKVLEEFSDKLPIERIKLKQNKGLGFALNYGLALCSHEIVVRMDTDDICDPLRFEHQVNFLNCNFDIDIVGTWAKDIDSEGAIIGERKYPTEHKDLYRLMWTNPVIHPAVAFRKSSILKIGSYNTEIVRRQDYELWIRAAHQGLKFANIPEFLLYYRFTPNYYKKNNLKVAWNQAVMGAKGAYKLQSPIYVYFAVFIPVFRSLLPPFIIKPVHKFLSLFDPRSKIRD